MIQLELPLSTNDAKEHRMNMFDAVMIAEGQIEADEDKQLEAWQFLHDSGLAYQLQGWFGRMARQMISEGLIQE